MIESREREEREKVILGDEDEFLVPVADEDPVVIHSRLIRDIFL